MKEKRRDLGPAVDEDDMVTPKLKISNNPTQVCQLLRCEDVLVISL